MSHPEVTEVGGGKVDVFIYFSALTHPSSRRIAEAALFDDRIDPFSVYTRFRCRRISTRRQSHSCERDRPSDVGLLLVLQRRIPHLS